MFVRQFAQFLEPSDQSLSAGFGQIVTQIEGILNAHGRHCPEILWISTVEDLIYVRF